MRMTEKLRVYFLCRPCLPSRRIESMVMFLLGRSLRCASTRNERLKQIQK